MHFEPFDKNVSNRSYNRIVSPKRQGDYIIQHFHTHGQSTDQEEATTPSKEDYVFKEATTTKYPDIQLIILHTYGQPILY